MHQKPDTEEGRTQGRERRLDLSVPQVAGSALAAVTAAVLASRLGVYGTIIGAGVVSVVATCGGSVLQHFFSRTGEQLREVTVQARPMSRKAPGRTATSEPVPDRTGWTSARPGEFTSATTHGSRVRGWKRPLIAAAVVFGVAMGGVTAYEVASGSELSGGKGTTVGSVVGGSTERRGPADFPSPTPDDSRDDQPHEPRQSPAPGGGASPGPDDDETKAPERPEGEPNESTEEEGSPDGAPGTDVPDGSPPPSGPAPAPTPPSEGRVPAPGPSAPAAGTDTGR
ncbi:hypothetical protein [Streptomyces sp. NBC_00690]|uniref:hypothetical protein n=1 Tax=Streptomyces sp. NBC_00690 TaxID=2975808 RepID=UPI002E2E2BC2|nr:hypothetical protein [Streptomyces sp. NBC_00690]